MILQYLPSVPVELLSDNGPEFRADEFANMLDSFGIKHMFTTPYSPSSNGAVERVNRSIQTILRNLCDKPNDWDENLSRALIAYNNTSHSKLNMSPSLFLLSKTHNNKQVPLIKSDDLMQKWKLGHPKYVSFKLNDYVIKKIPVTESLNINKLSLKYSGPYKISHVNSNNVTYQLEDLVSGKVIAAHHRDLILFKIPPKYLKTHPWFLNLDFSMNDFNISNDNPPFNDSYSFQSMSGIDSDEIESCEVSEYDMSTSNSMFEPVISDGIPTNVLLRNRKTADDIDETIDCYFCRKHQQVEDHLRNIELVQSTQRYVSVSSRHLSDFVNCTQRDEENPDQIVSEQVNYDCPQSNSNDIIFPFHDTTNQFWEFDTLFGEKDGKSIVSAKSVDAVPSDDGMSDVVLADETSGTNNVQLNDGSGDEIEDVDNFCSTPIFDSIPPRRHTRSMGVVKQLPNVQTKILERKNKSKK